MLFYVLSDEKELFTVHFFHFIGHLLRVLINNQFQPCSSTHASATGEWSPEKMKEKLNSMTDTVCGFHKKVPCLKNGREYFGRVKYDVPKS